MYHFDHITTFAGYPVKDFQPDQPLEAPANTVYRVRSIPPYASSPMDMLGCLMLPMGIAAGIIIGITYGAWTGIGAAVAVFVGCLVLFSIADRIRRGRFLKPQGDLLTLLERLAACPGADRVPGIIVAEVPNEGGTDFDAERLTQAVVSVSSRLRNLEAIFLSEVTAEECEISWIENGKVAPIFDAYPGLLHFQIRGGGPDFGQLRHGQLRRLVVESGGLARETVRRIAEASLPELEHLELWLGTPAYGGDARPEDVRALLALGKFPKLRHLGLRNAEIADYVVAELVESPILGQLEVLDLSLGCLSDEGAQRLLDCPAVRRLRKLDIHYHYVSESLMDRLQAMGIEVDVSDPQDPQNLGKEDRYCAISE